MKTCARCKTVKSEEDFSRQTKSKDGRYPYCKTCVSSRNKLLYTARGKHSWVNDKTCTWCKQLLPRTAYRKTAAGKVHPRCATCEDDIADHEARGLKRCGICREWLPHSAYHPSKVRVANNPCAVCARGQMKSYHLTRRDRDLRKNFGITLDQYKQLLELQNHQCPICLRKFEPNNYSYPIDHAHAGKFRGRIRAIVHDECNRHVLWAHDDSLQLRAAADLIDHPLTEWMVPEPMINFYEKRPKEARGVASPHRATMVAT